MKKQQDPEEMGLTWCEEHERWEHPDQNAHENGGGAVTAMVKAVAGVVSKQVRDPFAVATWQAQQMGYSDFSEGSPGRAKRDEIAEALKEEQ